MLLPRSYCDLLPNRAVDLVVAIMLAVSAPNAAALAAPAVSFSLPPTAGCGPNNVEGWEFQTTASITVSALGVYDSGEGNGDPTPGNGLNFSIPVGLYDSSCAQLASVTIPAGTAAALINGYRYVGIAPLVLSADQTFRVAAVMRCDDFTPQFQSPTGFVIDPSLTAVQTRRIAFGSSLACPTETSSVIGFAPNFLIGPACGNSVVQDGEQCDDGNTTDGDCCSSTCQYEANGSPCPADGEVCSDDVCDATGTCTHPAGNAGAICRPDVGECDVAEQCDGSTPTCPADGSEPNGTACTDDGLYCSGEETCQSGSCTSSGDPCTVGMCNEASDQCLVPAPTATATPVPNTATVTLTPSRTVTHTAVGSATRTATSTATASVTPTQATSPAATVTPAATASVTPSTHATITPSPTPTDTPAAVPCVGDCDGSCNVEINELITGVNIALGTLPLASCPAFDPSGNGGVEINELITAVNNALNGCP